MEMKMKIRWRKAEGAYFINSKVGGFSSENISFQSNESKPVFKSADGRMWVLQYQIQQPGYAPKWVDAEFLE